MEEIISTCSKAPGISPILTNRSLPTIHDPCLEASPGKRKLSLGTFHYMAEFNPIWCLKWSSVLVGRNDNDPPWFSHKLRVFLDQILASKYSIKTTVRIGTRKLFESCKCVCTCTRTFLCSFPCLYSISCSSPVRGRSQYYLVSPTNQTGQSRVTTRHSFLTMVCYQIEYTPRNYNKDPIVVRILQSSSWLARRRLKAKY